MKWGLKPSYNERSTMSQCNSLQRSAIDDPKHRTPAAIAKWSCTPVVAESVRKLKNLKVDRALAWYERGWSSVLIIMSSFFGVQDNSNTWKTNYIMYCVKGATMHLKPFHGKRCRLPERTAFSLAKTCETVRLRLI